MYSMPLFEPFDRRSHLIWLAGIARMRRAAKPAPSARVPLRSEAFAEDLEGLVAVQVAAPGPRSDR